MKNEVVNASPKLEPPWWLPLFIFLLLLSIVVFFANLFGEKRSKSVLAAEYGVSVKVLMKWIKMFCKPEYIQQYVGTKKKKISVYHLRRAIGKPEDYPLYKEKTIVTKSDLERACSISPSTLLARIKSVSDPELQIGMRYEQYKQLNTIPPLQMKRIVDYLTKKGQHTTPI